MEAIIMWLITTLVGAFIATAAWYVLPKKYKLHLLSLMFWGASLMILVDHIIGYEGGAFLELQTEGLITNSTALGILMIIPVLLFWLIVLTITKPKEKSIGG